MLTIQLDPALERRLIELAKQTGQTAGDFALELIERSIEDFEDIQMAEARLEKRQQPLTSEQARKALGLED